MARRLLTVTLGSKQPYEILDWKIKLAQSLSSGQTISTIAASTVTRTDAVETPAALKLLTSDTPATPANPVRADSNTSVVFWTAGGTAGGTYKITFQLTASDGAKFEFDTFIAIKDA